MVLVCCCVIDVSLDVLDAKSDYYHVNPVHPVQLFFRFSLLLILRSEFCILRFYIDLRIFFV